MVIHWLAMGAVATGLFSRMWSGSVEAKTFTSPSMAGLVSHFMIMLLLALSSSHAAVMWGVTLPQAESNSVRASPFNRFLYIQTSAYFRFFGVSVVNRLFFSP